MGKIIYKKISLFDAPKDSLLVHSCNGQGVWASGIAKEFKEKFPKSFEAYNHYCIWNKVDVGPNEGTAMICPEENRYRIGCLITSENFGAKVDSPEIILDNTYNALLDLFDLNRRKLLIYSNKFNSGLFKVPWEKTEEILNQFIESLDYDWIVCCPDLEEK